MLDVADHAEVDDRAVQLGVLDGTEGLEDLLGGDGMTGSIGRRVGPPSVRALDFHYARR